VSTTESTTETAAVEETKATEEQVSEATEAEANTENEKPAQQDDDAALPEWAKAKISKLNSENASWRTQLRETQEKLQAAKSPEDFEAATKEMAGKVAALEQELTRTQVISEHRLDAEYAALLPQEGTKEELEAKAKLIAKLAGSARRGPDDLAGGLDPSEGDDAAFDPVAASRNARARRY
jgi:hypothetical protein